MPLKFLEKTFLGTLWRGSERGPKNNWRDKALEELSAADRKNFQKLRRSFEGRGKQQRWLYAGANADISPVLMAPADAKHYFVDPIYKKYEDQEFDIDKATWQTMPFTNLGVHAELRPLGTTDGTSHDIVQTSDGTTIHLLGRDATKPESLPDEQIDVVYTNTVSWFRGPAPVPALDKLKTGGLFVYMARKTYESKTWNLRYVDKDIRDLGFVDKAAVPINELNIPAITETSNISGEQQPVTIMVFEKTRELTPDEINYLRLNEAFSEIMSELKMVMHFEFDPEWPMDGHPIQDVEQAKTEFTTAVEKLVSLLGLMSEKHKQTALKTFKKLFNSDEVTTTSLIRDEFYASGIYTGEFVKSITKIPKELADLKRIAAEKLRTIGLDL